MQPVVTPIERLRRKDREVANALEEKQKLIEDILNMPHQVNLLTSGQNDLSNAVLLLMKCFCPLLQIKQNKL